MVYVEPTLLNTDFENSKHNDYIRNKDKQDKLQKRNFK